MRPRLLGPALLAVAIGACGTTAPTPPAAAQRTPVSTALPPATPASSPSPSGPADVDAEVDIGGRRMHLVCKGAAGGGEPTILLEAGLDDDTGAWDGILRAMAPAHHVCAYDRAGLGHSDPAADRSRTAADQVEDLHALLDAAALDGPFVLGAHSYGAEVAIVFTQAYPDDVAGLLFVDPRSPRISSRFRAALPDVAENEPDGLVELRYSLGTFETEPVLNRENLNLHQSYEEANAALDPAGPAFGDRPVVVLSAGNSLAAQMGVPPDLAATLDGIWLAGHRELADESTAGTVEVVPGSGHYIQADRPQAVIDGLERILGDLASP